MRSNGLPSTKCHKLNETSRRLFTGGPSAPLPHQAPDGSAQVVDSAPVTTVAALFAAAFFAPTSACALLRR